jgi:DNA polymerase III subunit epsilon
MPAAKHIGDRAGWGTAISRAIGRAEFQTETLPKGDTILTSQRLDFLVRPKEPVSARTILIHHIRPIDLEGALPVDDAIRRVLEFVGPRPLIGYFLEFDMGMLNKYVRPLIGARLPNTRVEVSSLY